MNKAISTSLVALVGYGILAVAGIVSSAPIDFVLSVVKSILVG